jgi:hypothetical protein
MDDEFDKLLSDLEGYTKTQKAASNAAPSTDHTPVKGPEPPRPSGTIYYLIGINFD